MKLSKIKSLLSRVPEPTVGVLKSILGFIGIFMVSAIVAEIIIMLIFTLVGIDIFGGSLPQNNLLVQTIPLYGFILFMITSIIYCKFIEKRSLKSMGFTNKGIISNYIKGLIIGILLVSIVLFIALSSGALTYQGISENINTLTVLVFLGGYIIQGMSEEVMCRGYLMISLSKKISIFWAIIISSLAFVFPHLYSLMMSGVTFGIIGFINTMLFSVLVSIFMIRKKNIWLIAAIHSTWNFILGVFFGISVSGGKTGPSIFNFTTNQSHALINGGKYGLEASIITTLILLLTYGIKSKKRT